MPSLQLYITEHGRIRDIHFLSNVNGYGQRMIRLPDVTAGNRGMHYITLFVPKRSPI